MTQAFDTTTREVASGLQFPEGPVYMPDGTIIVVEIARGTVSHIALNGKVSVIATPGGGPNGAALGPDGALYICNNGGARWHRKNGRIIPSDRGEDYSGGRIERVDLNNGTVETLYTQCNGEALKGPNDIVFDAHGGFWFTDLGKTTKRHNDYGGLYYATPDGNSIREVVFPMHSANGVGLSPNGTTVYVADTVPGRLWAFEIAAPGKLKPSASPFKGVCLAGMPGLQYFDSLAVDSEGHVCVATIFNGGITRISPEGKTAHFATDDPVTTNICFGGDNLRHAYITLSSTGRLVETLWPVEGLPLNYGATKT